MMGNARPAETCTSLLAYEDAVPTETDTCQLWYLLHLAAVVLGWAGKSTRVFSRLKRIKRRMLLTSAARFPR